MDLEIATTGTTRGPVFVVGCSRSGTTLLHSILSQHGDFVGFPETNVFNKVLDDVDVRRFGRRIFKRKRLFRVVRSRIMNAFGMTAGFDWDALPKCKKRLESSLGVDNVEGGVLTGRRWSIHRIFNEIGDQLERAAGGKRWIEKSPQNLWSLHLLVRYFPTATFIHILREGTSNVASLVDAGRKYKAFRSRFGGSQGVDKAVRFYNAAVEVSCRFKGDPRHAFVRYEDLAEEPGKTLEPVGRLLGVNIDESMLRYVTEGIVTMSEVWKVGSPEIKRRESKFETVFDEDEKKYVRDRILDVERLFPRKFASGMENVVPTVGTHTEPVNNSV